jgi:hypothetical protein
MSTGCAPEAVGCIARVDRDVLAGLAPEPTRLGEALTALAAAAVTLRARVVPHVPPWTLIGQITHSRLVLARPQPGGIVTTPTSRSCAPARATVPTWTAP